MDSISFLNDRIILFSSFDQLIFNIKQLIEREKEYERSLEEEMKAIRHIASAGSLSLYFS